MHRDGPCPSYKRGWRREGGGERKGRKGKEKEKKRVLDVLPLNGELGGLNELASSFAVRAVLHSGALAGGALSGGENPKREGRERTGFFPEPLQSGQETPSCLRLPVPEQETQRCWVVPVQLMHLMRSFPSPKRRRRE